MKRLASILILPATLMTQGCAGLYLHDPALAKQTADTAAAFTPATLMAPFDLEESYLTQFASDEDRAIIDYNLAERDRILAGFVDGEDQPGPKVKIEASNAWKGLSSESASRLKALLGDTPVDLGKLAELGGDRARWLATYDASVRFNQGPYLQLSPAGTKPLTCERVTDKASDAEKASWAAARDPQTPDIYAGNIRRACLSRRETLISWPASAIAGDGLLRQAYDQVTAAEKTIKAKTPVEQDQELAAQIKQAEDLAKNGPSKQLDDFLTSARDGLDALKGAARLAKWEKLETEIGRVLLAEICGKDSTATAEAKTEAKCGSLKPGDTAFKTDAALHLLGAFAGLDQAMQIGGRNANWILAANVIANANVADAKIEAVRDKAQLRQLSARLNALTAEASALACTQLALTSGCRGAKGYHLALASYVESWNVGRVPENVYAAREVREGRASSLKRARAAADRQVTLMVAATRQADLVAKGGVKSEVGAQLLTASGLIAIAGNN